MPITMFRKDNQRIPMAPTLIGFCPPSRITKASFSLNNVLDSLKGV